MDAGRCETTLLRNFLADGLEMMTVDVLNRLLAMHSRSLPTYLVSAPPWYPESDSNAMVALRHVAEDHALMVDRLGAEIMREHGAVKAGEFPMTYTDLHDLSIDFVLRQVVSELQGNLEEIQTCMDQLQNAPAAKALAEEALGATQGHLDNLVSLESVS